MYYLHKYRKYKQLVLESQDSERYEYQYREIVDSYYRRVKGTEIWSFTTKEDYLENATDNNQIPYKK